MLNRIPGIDPVILNNVKERTNKQVVQDTRGLKVTEHEQKNKGRQWLKEGKREELAEFLDELNLELEANNMPLRIYLRQEENRWVVHVVEIASQKIVQKLSVQAAGKLLGRSYRQAGLLLDDKI